MTLARVAVPVPGLGLLTYGVPEGTDVMAGMRVVVPVGARRMTGLVIEVVEAASADDVPRRLRDLGEVLDLQPFLPEDVVRLALWVADYYLAGPGEAIATALPPRGWLRSDASLTVAAGVDAGDVRAADAAVFAAVQAAGPTLRSRVERVVRQQLGEGVSPTHVRRSLAALLRAGVVQSQPVVTGRADASQRRRWIVATPVLRAGDALPTARRQAELCGLLRASPDGVDSTVLRGQGIGSDTLRRVVALGLATIEWRAVDRDPFDAGLMGELNAAEGPTFLPLTSEQQVVIDTLSPHVTSRRFAVALLQGVTGSGKTQVYLRLARATIEAGRQVLLLVPEIALTPAVARLLRRAFGERVAIQHSGLSDGERHDQWHRIRRGDIAVVVGTRSAVFAPLPAPGLVIVDEEHDSAYKQEESPRYNGRDAAIMRARDAGALVVLGSATPSLETFRNASEGRYLWLRMTRRVLNRPLAEVQVVDMREELAAEGPDVVLSRPLVSALDDCLGRGEQAIVLLNRRGYAPSLFCRSCGGTTDCPNCSVTLTVHRAAAQLRCHYCNHVQGVPARCPACQGEYLEYTGIGTERVEQDVVSRFPDARIARVDRDTMRRRGAIARVLQRFARREVDVLVGTQMIAKGHDFPQVTLVGVISADIGLGVADFRAAERTFQLLTQVAGRAGRGTSAGLALIQTLHPQHYAIVHAAGQDYDAFSTRELEFRERLRYPPLVSMVNLVVRHASAGTAMRDATTLAGALRAPRAFAVLGPAPAPLGRLRGEARVQLFLKGRQRGAMRDSVRRTLDAHPEIARRTTVDVDPLNLL
jgi:primosomal protein N' (replication factor Y) (superfamily II helicase)